MAAVVAALLGLLAAACGVAWWGWSQLTDVADGHARLDRVGARWRCRPGLGVGLMWLVFFSHRHGYDERAGRD